MKAAVYDAAGEPQVLHYRDVADPPCPPDGVLIRVEAISIEGGDLINRASTPPPSPGYVLGYASAGEVVAVGPQVRDRFVGQRVTGFDLCGSHAAMRAIQASKTWLVPDGLDMAAAAALPISFGTAYHCLFTRGGLSEGETVLIQGGAGVLVSPLSSWRIRPGQWCSRLSRAMTARNGWQLLDSAMQSTIVRPMLPKKLCV
ncbi:zinc-binding alcohol dehydrogenase family protein [Pseudoroseomonas wenyumeiae]